MPRLTFDFVLQQAISSAVLDRESLADAYSNEGPHARSAKDEAKAIGALRGRKVSSMSDSDMPVVFLALVCAEQWEHSLGQAQGEKRFARRCFQLAQRFREFRLKAMGPSVLEAEMATAKAVPIMDLLKRTSSGN